MDLKLIFNDSTFTYTFNYKNCKKVKNKCELFHIIPMCKTVTSDLFESLAFWTRCIF